MPDEPLRSTTVTLTSADALAYEQAASRMTPLGNLALFCWLGLCAAAALLIPPDWAGMRLSWSFGLLIIIFTTIGYTLALLLMATRQWLAARRRQRRPQQMSFTEWPGRLEISAAGLPETLAFSAVRRSILTPTHLFLESDRDPVILPRRAFPEAGSIEALEKRIADAAGALLAIVPPPESPAPPVPAASLTAAEKPTIIEPALPTPPPAIAALALSLASPSPVPAEPPAAPPAVEPAPTPPVDPEASSA